jgi:hypothetical protein
VNARNRWLAAVVLLLGLLTWLDARRAPRAIDERPWLAGFDPAAVTRVHLARGDAEVELARGASGWAVLSRASFPAEGGAVDELLRRVAGVRSSDRVAADPDTHARLGVGPGALRARFADAGGKLLADLCIGRPDDGRGGACLRRADGDEVFRLATLSVPDPAPAHWLEARLLDFAPPDVRRFAATLGDERFELVRLPDGRWQAQEGQRLLSAARVDPVLLVAANLFLEELSEATADAAGFARPAGTIELDLEGGRRLGLTLGGTLPEGGRAARREDFDPRWTARVPTSAVSRLEDGLQRVLEELGGR